MKRDMINFENKPDLRPQIQDIAEFHGLKNISDVIRFVILKEYRDIAIPSDGDKSSNVTVKSKRVIAVQHIDGTLEVAPEVAR